MASWFGSTPFVIAVDSGGTHTRAACFGLDGALLSTSMGAGGSPYHDAAGARNVAETVTACVAAGDLAAPRARALVAGMAAIGRVGSDQGSEDEAWAAGLFPLPGLDCPRTVVNDATTAHRGGLLGEPGVAVLAGTGSMITAITADGRELESGFFEHYAGAARHLAGTAVQLLLTEGAAAADDAFVRAVLEHWGAADVEDLRARILGLVGDDRRLVRRRCGALAPAVTAAAGTSPLADRAVRELAATTALGVRLLLPLVGGDPVPVVTIGALGEHPAFTARLAHALEGTRGPAARIVRPVLDPLRGAALMAYGTAGVEVTAELVATLAASAEIGGARVGGAVRRR